MTRRGLGTRIGLCKVGETDKVPAQIDPTVLGKFVLRLWKNIGGHAGRDKHMNNGTV